MITVHTMGVHYRWEMPEVLRQQLRLAHDLREDLVSLQLAYDSDLQGIWSSYPNVAAAESAATEAEQRAAAAVAAVKDERIRLRTKKVDTSLASTLRETRREVKAARQARRAAIGAVKDAAAELRKRRSDQLKADQKALYRHYCQDGGLFWATFNAVLDHHQTAVQRINSRRAAGKPAALRHHRFDGTGTVAVQLQRQAGTPPRTPAVVADPAGKYRNVLCIPWRDPQEWSRMSRAEQRHAGRITVRMRCGSTNGDPAWIEMPAQAHRWLPADADVTGAQLTVTRTASALRARLAITAKIPDASPRRGPTLAVHLGWRTTDEGTVVATWRATEPLTIPAQLRNVLVADRDRLTGRVIIPAVIATRLDRHATTASVRDLTLDALRAKLVDWLHEHGPQPYRDGSVGAADAARWRSPARFAALAIAWRDNPPHPEIAALLESWRCADKKLWEGQEHGRAAAHGHRDDLRRQVAAALSATCGHIVLDDTSVADLAAHAVARSDLPNVVQQRIDRRRDHAAPGKLRELIKSAALRDGVTITIVPAAGLGRTHARCGHINPSDDRYFTRPVPCDGCGVTYDPDQSATVLMMRAVAPKDTTQRAFANRPTSTDIRWSRP